MVRDFADKEQEKGRPVEIRLDKFHFSRFMNQRS